MLPAIYNENQGQLNGFSAWVKRNKGKVLKAAGIMATATAFIPALAPLTALVSVAAGAMEAYDDVADLVGGSSVKVDKSLAMNGTIPIVPVVSTTSSTSFIRTPIISSIPESLLTPTPQVIIPTVANDGEPTADDIARLDPWVDSKLQPYYNQLMVDLATAFENSDPAVQLDGINTVMLQMDVVEENFRLYNMYNLSDNGQAARLELIQEIFAPVRKVIADAIAQNSNIIKKVSYQYKYVSADKHLFENILTIGTLIGRSDVYLSEKYVATEQQKAIAPTTAPVQSDLVTEIAEPRTSTATTRFTEVDTAPVTENTADAAATGAPATSNNDTIKILGFIGLGIVAIKFLSKSKTTKKK